MNIYTVNFTHFYIVNKTVHVVLVNAYQTVTNTDISEWLDFANRLIGKGSRIIMSLFSDSEGSNSSSDINVMFGSHAVAPNSPTPYTDATQVGSKTLIHG